MSFNYVQENSPALQRWVIGAFFRNSPERDESAVLPSPMGLGSGMLSIPSVKTLGYFQTGAFLQ
jgi:hypothetical protein